MIAQDFFRVQVLASLQPGENANWGAGDRRHEMNHFMARLIFCFFAEDTDIFNGKGLFTDTIERMSSRDSSNTEEVIAEIFRAMNTEVDARKAADIPRWAGVAAHW